MKTLPTSCPSCQSSLEVKRLSCPECGTSVEGDFPLPDWMKLSEDEQKFVLEFVKSSGSLKKMAASMGRSYPLVRNILDDIIKKLSTKNSKT